MRKSFLYPLFFILISAMPCPQAAAQYYLKQDIPQVVRYIQGSQQYILKASYVISGIEEAKTAGSGALLQKAEGKFVIVKFKASNKSAMPAPSIVLLDIILIDGRKNRWEQSLSATGSVRIFKEAKMAVDSEVEDAVVFDIPENIKDYFILLPGGAKVSPAAYAGPPDIKKAQEQKLEQAEGKGKPKKTAVVIENAVHLRSSPSLESAPVSWSLKGTVFEVTGEFREGGRKWYKVKAANGKEYWIVGKVVKIKEDTGARPAEDKQQIKEEKAAARKPEEVKPEAAKKKTEEPEQAKVEIKAPEPAKSAEKPVAEAKTETPKAEIKTPEAAKPEPRAAVPLKPDKKERKGIKVVTNAATLRSQPLSDAEPAAWVSKGAVFDVMEEARDAAGRKWYKVRTQYGKTGWLRDIVVSVDKKSEAAAVESVKPKTEDGKIKEKVDEKAKEEPKEKTEDKKKGGRTATIIVNAAHLRLKPSLESNPATWSLKGTVFDVADEFSEPGGRKWFKVKAADGKEYWIVGRMVKIKDEQKADAKGAEDVKPEVKTGHAKPAEKPSAETKTEIAKTGSKAPKPLEKRTDESTAKETWKRTATIIVKTAVLRERPSFEAEKTGRVPKGAMFEVVNEFTEADGRKWYKVKAPKGRESWIPDNAANISPFSLIEEKFIESGLASVEPEVEEAKKKVVESMKGEWAEKSGGSGHKRRKTITVSKEYAILRAEPSKSSRVVTWVSQNTVFEVLEETADSEGGKWYRVKSLNDTECWVAEGMVNISSSGQDEKEIGTAEPATGKKERRDKKTTEKNKKPDSHKEQADAGELKRLLDEAGVFYKEGNCSGYVNNYEKAIRIEAARNNNAAEGKLHFNIAECYVILKRYEDAVRHLDAAHAIAEKTGDKELEILSFVGKNRAVIIALDGKNCAEILKNISGKLDRDIFLNVFASDYLRALASFQAAYVLLDVKDVSSARERLNYALMVNHDFKMEDDIVKLIKTIDILVFEELSAIDRILEDAWSSYEKGDFRKMEELALLALDRAKRHRYKRGMFSGNYYLAMSLSNLGESKKAMDYVLGAMELAEKGGDEMSIGMTYNLTGNIFKQENAFDKALYYCNKYLDISRKSGNREGEALALNNIGNLLMDKGDYALALKYYEDSMKIIVEIGSTKYLLAQGYLSLGRAFKKLGNYGKAEENIVAARNIFKELGNRGGELTGIWEIAGNYGMRGEYNSAIKILEDNLSRSEGTVLEKSFIEDLIEYAEKSNDSERAEKYRKMKGS